MNRHHQRLAGRHSTTSKLRQKTTWFEYLEPRQLLSANGGETEFPEAESVAEQVVVASTPQLEASSNYQESPAFIELPAGLPAQFLAMVDFAGETLTLQLDKNSVFGENTRFLVDDGTGNLIQIDHGVDRSYLGTVAEQPNYAVSATLTAEGLRATIIRPGQPSLTVEPALASSAEANGAMLHLVSVDEAVPTNYDHDHNHDGVPDHAPEDHIDETGGGHPPGCTCAACCGESSTFDADLPAAIATLPPTRSIDVRQYEVGVEIGSAALLNNYSGATTQDKVNHAMSVAQGIPGNLDARFLRAAGIKHELGTVIIRTTSDPFTVGNGNDNAGLNAFRDYWNNLQANEGIAPTHDLAVYHVRASPSGLAYVNSVGSSNRYALSASNGPTSWADGTLAHEFGHSWNLGHVPGGTVSSASFYEARPRSNGSTAGGTDDFISIMHGGGDHNIGRLSTGEANRVLGAKSNKLSFGDPVSPGPVAPYGWADSATSFGTPITIDVIANDHDANNDTLDVQLRDTVSFLGGTIALSNDTGPGGRDEIIYTPPSGSGTDFFHYTVIDGTGRSDWGAVYVTNQGPIVINPNQTSYNYDLGPATSVQTGWTGITPETTGDLNWSTTPSATDRGSIPGINDINRDFVTSSGPATLNHKLPNGIWSVTMNMGDATMARNNMSVSIEGQLIDNDIDSPEAQFTYVDDDGTSTGSPASLLVEVTDGELNIEMDVAAGSSWVWNRLSISLVDALDPPGDFNSNGYVDAVDLPEWLADYGNNDGSDADGDGDSDGSDFLAWQQAYRPGSIFTSPLIDDTLTNGNSGLLTTTSSSSVGQATTSEPSLTTNDNGRALVNSSTIEDWVQIPGWRASRAAHPGGNVAFGFDGALGIGSDPIQYAFVNSGAIRLDSDPISGPFQQGDTFDLSFLVGGQAASTAQASIIVDGEHSHTFPVINGTEAGALFTGSYELFGSADSVVISIIMDTVEIGAQFKLDTIELDITTLGIPVNETVTLLDSSTNNGSFEIIDPHTAPSSIGNRRASFNSSPFLIGGSMLTAGAWEITGNNTFHGVDSSTVGGGAQHGDIALFAINNALNNALSAPISQTVTAGDEFEVSFYTMNSEASGVHDYSLILRFDGNPTNDLILASGTHDSSTDGGEDTWVYRTGTELAPVNASSVQVLARLDNTSGGTFDQAFLDNITLKQQTFSDALQASSGASPVVALAATDQVEISVIELPGVLGSPATRLISIDEAHLIKTVSNPAAADAETLLHLARVREEIDASVSIETEGESTQEELAVELAFENWNVL